MLISSLCDYSDADILIRETITVPNTAAADANPNNSNKEVINTDRYKNIDVVMLMYNIIKYSDNYLKSSGGFWQYYRNESALINITVDNFPDVSASFKFKQKTGNDGTKHVEIMVSLKYLRNFWRTLEMSLII